MPMQADWRASIKFVNKFVNKFKLSLQFLLQKLIHLRRIAFALSRFHGLAN
jgi:hypothetical protein